MVCNTSGLMMRDLTSATSGLQSFQLPGVVPQCTLSSVDLVLIPQDVIDHLIHALDDRGQCLLGLVAGPAES
eukprot:76853-Pelagomonas_calceolata.AAC.1